jgi:hypothetical protein
MKLIAISTDSAAAKLDLILNYDIKSGLGRVAEGKED